MRKVPLAQIKPQLLEKEGEGKLVEAFCAGVWGGIGMLFFWQLGLFQGIGIGIRDVMHELWLIVVIEQDMHTSGAI